MTESEDVIRIQHLKLIDVITRQTQRLWTNPSDVDFNALATWLNGDLLAHVVGEEQHLYPAVEPLIRAHGKATATMQLDHRIIEDYVRDICVMIETIPIVASDERSTLYRMLQRLITRLEGILRLHLEKEDDIYLPLFQQYLPESERKIIISEIEKGYSMAGVGTG